MPTRYTADLMDLNKPVPPFEQFAMRCARAFGPLVTMRDEPMDAPIPERIEPSDYHAKALVDAKARLAELSGMNDAAAEQYGAQSKAEVVKGYTEILEGYERENARLMAMIAEVDGWNPPSPDHEPLKGFMHVQLRASMNEAKYAKDSLLAAIERPAIEFYRADLAAAERDANYHESEHASDVKRAESHTRWLQQLRESLASTATAV